MLNDLRFALRMLLKSPGFTATAILTLALGSGATTAIFSVVNAVLLRSLPYKSPDRLVILWKTILKKNSQEDWTSYPTFKDWRDQNQVFEDMALVFRPAAAEVTLTGTNESEQIQAAKVSANFFSVLGVPPFLGRSFSSGEGERGDPLAVLSHGFWQRHFGSSPDAIGESLEIDGINSTVIGIMPPDFQFPSKDVQFWLLNTADSRWPRFTVIRLADAFCGIGRLKPNVTFEQAQAEMSTIACRLEQQYPETDAGLGIKIVPLHLQIAGSKLRLTLWMLFGAVAFVLLIACTNVANLLLARGAVRAREMALRTALGAGRWRLIRQLVTESTVLSLASGFLGLCFAELGVRTLIALGPANIPRLEETGIDPEVLAFTLAVSILAGLLFGLAPAWKASRIDPNESLKEGGRGSSGGLAGSRTHGLLIVLEFALAVVLLTGTGLLVRSLLCIQQVDFGFRPEDILTMQIHLPQKYAEGERTTAFLEQAIQKLEALPGVQAAGVIGGVAGLFSGEGFAESSPNVIMTVEGRPPIPPGEHREQSTDSRISDSYFEVMGVPLLRGRFFSDQDRLDSPPVAIINQTMARRFWPGEDPIAKRFRYGIPGWNSDWHTIVAIVGDMLPYGPESRTIPECYLPQKQQPWMPAINFVVRTASDPLSVAEVARREIQLIDKTIPRFEITTVEYRLRQLGSTRRFQTWLLGLFSLLALLLAAIGIYGVMSYFVAQRTHEIGIRIALGAQPRDVLGIVIGQGLGLALIGVAAGLLGSLWLAQALSSLLFGVNPTDPTTLASVSALLTAVALLACYIPARRAMKVDPMVALRCE